jgi:hypothetical protein
VPIITKSLARSRSGPPNSQKAAADGVDHPGGHVHRAETAVGGVVGGAELLGEEAGEGLHLVAAGEDGELLGIGGADVGEALLHDLEGLVPGDDLEFGLAPLRALFP